MPKLKSTHVDSAAAVGRRLREARERASLSQRQLSFPGCTPAYISRIEAGQRTASLQLLGELGDRLGVSAESLATGDRGAPARGDVEGGVKRQALRDADIALRLGEVEEAERLFGEIVEGAADRFERGDALAGLGHVAFRRGEPRQAVEHFEAALAELGTTEVDHPLLAEELGRAYAMTAEAESAVAVFERCLAAAEERGDEIGQARFAVLLANILIDIGNLGRAEELLGQTLARVDASADATARARVYWTQSRLHTFRGNSEAAARYAGRALEILEATEDTHAIARAHLLLAHIELDRRNTDEALALLGKGEALLATTGNRFEHARLRLERARALAALGEEEAVALAMDAASVLAETNSVDAGRGYLIVAEAFDSRDDFAHAAELYELAAELLEQAPSRYLAETYFRLGELREREGDTSQALALFKKAAQVQQRVDVAERQ